MKTMEERYSTIKRNVAVVGGIMGLEPEYTRILKENNLVPRVYNQGRVGLKEKVEGTDLIILFAGTVSHKMAQIVRKVAGVRQIPIVTVRPSSISALKRSIDKVL
jgi:hypothetical protein